MHVTVFCARVFLKSHKFLYNSTMSKKQDFFIAFISFLKLTNHSARDSSYILYYYLVL